MSIKITGENLKYSDVAALAQGKLKVELDPSITKKVNDSVAFLKSKLNTSVYGVTTGFGGSADTRTSDTVALQVSLLEHQLMGILPTKPELQSHNALSRDIVRGAMLIRTNSLARGHSAVRLEILERLVYFINNDITPIVPLRGSISASGDLSPLSYIAGALTGHPDVYVTYKGATVSSDSLTAQLGLEKIELGPKEGLGLVNGTAVSAAAACLALSKSLILMDVAVKATALTVEALQGHVGSFHPFIHDTARPHPGQVAVAEKMRSLLAESKLATHVETEVSVDADMGVLRQDRYPLRTSAQWLGPAHEAFEEAKETLTNEVNSTTDNPLVDVENGILHHGGNFQAMAVTCVMEKVRLHLQHIGKLSFTQMSELVNCTMNRGLPSCLAWDEPSTNYHTKGLDIASAAYTAELGYLANPVSTHVQNAEMGNQSVNSLALISARMTLEAADVLTMLLSSHLYSACQALDLRTRDEAVRHKLKSKTETEFVNVLEEQHRNAINVSQLIEDVWHHFEQTTTMDLHEKWDDAAHKVFATVAYGENGPSISEARRFAAAISEEGIRLALETRKDLSRETTSTFLGKGTKETYEFVRKTLGVKPRQGDVAKGYRQMTVGRAVSTIYESALFQ